MTERPTFTEEDKENARRYGYTGVYWISTEATRCLPCAVGKPFTDEDDCGEIHPDNVDPDVNIVCDDCGAVVVRAIR